jgi:hypothetical protein
MPTDKIRVRDASFGPVGVMPGYTPCEFSCIDELGGKPVCGTHDPTQTRSPTLNGGIVSIVTLTDATMYKFEGWNYIDGIRGTLTQIEG